MNFVGGGCEGGILLTISAGAEVKNKLNWLAISAGSVNLIPLQKSSFMGLESFKSGSTAVRISSHVFF